jgi:hypothetical protein
MFNLHNQKLTLLNGTTFRYGQLKIPCCSQCNNVHLSAVDRQVSEAVEKGADAVRHLDPLTLHIWLAKTFYGILYREAFLKRDLRSKKKATIFPRYWLRHFRLLHFSLQGARFPMVAEAMQPEVAFPLSSVFIFDTYNPPKMEARFDFRDTLSPMAVSIRMGRVAIIAVFSDGGTLGHELAATTFWQNLQGRTLHPLQFVELTARIVYHASLFARDPGYLVETKDDVTLINQLPIQGLSKAPMYREWVGDDFVEVLWGLMRQQRPGLTIEDLHPAPNMVRSFLFGPEGQFVDIDLTKQPWPPPPRPAASPSDPKTEIAPQPGNR